MIYNLIFIMITNYQGRIDPLQQLRMFMTQKRKIKQRDGYLHFGNIKFKLQTETPWLSPITHKQYSLGSLWLILDSNLNRLNAASYLDRSSQLGVDIVSTVDKSEILAYFHGKILESACINKTLKLQIIQKQLKKDKEREDIRPIKDAKIKTQAELNLEVMIWLKNIEKPVVSKDGTLRTPQRSYEGVVETLRSANDRIQTSKKHIKSRLTSIYERKKNPIIIVPESNLPGNVCIKNIKNLLIDGYFVDSTDLQDTISRKIEILFPIKEKNVTFQITNNPCLLTPLQWKCVIAIFVSGRQTQFFGCQQTNPFRIFQRYKGFFVKYSDLKLTQAKDWNVKVINIHKMARYEDVSIQKFIWSQIEKQLLQSVNE